MQWKQKYPAFFIIYSVGEVAKQDKMSNKVQESELSKFDYNLVNAAAKYKKIHKFSLQMTPKMITQLQDYKMSNFKSNWKTHQFPILQNWLVLV